MIQYQTTSTILSWMVFVPIIGTVCILAAISIRYLFRFDKKFVDNASRLISLISTFIVFLLSYFAPFSEK